MACRCSADPLQTRRPGGPRTRDLRASKRRPSHRATGTQHGPGRATSRETLGMTSHGPAAVSMSKLNTRGGTRTRNLLLRGEAPYPLGRTSTCHSREGECARSKNRAPGSLPACEASPPPAAPQHCAAPDVEQLCTRLPSARPGLDPRRARLRSADGHRLQVLPTDACRATPAE